MKTVYLAGPMSGLPQYNFPNFLLAAKCLRESGLEVISPAEHDMENGFDPIKEIIAPAYDLEAAMEWDIQAVLRSDAVVVLPGWERSFGAGVEITVAKSTGRPVLEYPSLEPIKEESVTQEAHRIVNGARQASYGHPADDFARTGRMWGAILGIDDVPPHLVGLCQVALKVSREVNGHKRDNLVDIAGYAETVALVHERSDQ